MSSKLKRSGQVDVEVAATPEQVWAVLTDVTRVGDWSGECHTAQWLDGAEGAAAGVRFRGANKNGFARWSKKCTITDVEPTRRFVYETHSSALDPGATRWSFTLEPAAGGCRLSQSFEIINMPKAAEWVITKVLPAHIDRTQELRADLERLGALAAQVPT